jgi:hypothetical protein
LGPPNPDPDVYIAIEVEISEEQPEKATEIQIMLMTKWMGQKFPGTNEAHYLRDGRLLLGTKSLKIAENAIENAITIYDKYEVRVRMMDTTNRVQASIFGKEILSMDIEAVKEALAEKNVVDVERISTMRNGQVSPHGLHGFTFSRKFLFESIAIGYMRYHLRVLTDMKGSAKIRLDV